MLERRVERKPSMILSGNGERSVPECVVGHAGPIEVAIGAKPFLTEYLVAGTLEGKSMKVV